MNILNQPINIMIKVGRLLRNWCLEFYYSFLDFKGYAEQDATWKHVGESFRKLWGDSNKSDGPAILIEGFMASSGPNYLYRICLHANAIKDQHGGAKLEVVYDDFRFRFRRETWLLGLAGCTGFHYLRQSPINLIHLASAFFKTLTVWKSLSKVEDILTLKLGPICYGDLLYDEILKRDNNSKTINRITLKHVGTIFRAIYLIKKYQHFVRNHNFKYYVTTHPCYLQYGIMCRVAMNAGAKLILTTDIEAVVIDKTIDENSGWSPVYHEYVADYIRGELKDVNEESILKARTYLKERFEGSIDQVDVKLAFENKKEMSREELLGSKSPDTKIGFVMAHIMSDASHCSHRMLYRDYLVWLQETLKLCSQNKNIHWLVKPHPAAEVYKEAGVVENEVRKLGADNVTICPEEMSTATVASVADVVLTMQGTAGLEFSCAGLPVILAGAPFYSDFGFTKDCHNIAQYEETMLAAHTLPRLTEEEEQKAFKVLAAYQNFVITNNLVFDANLLAKIWGYQKSEKGDVLDTFSSRLEELDVRMEPQYKRITRQLNHRQEA